MALETRLGRIKAASFGFGGYDGAMVGLSLSFAGEGWGVDDFSGTWATRPDGALWSFDDQRADFANSVALLRDTLAAARKRDVAQLAGVPVEVTFEGNLLKTWRVLTEVIG